MSDYKTLLDWLYGLKWFGIRPGLERIEEVMEKLGSPQDRIRTIHVTGTNGKGSVCAMISSVLQEAGCRVGMFTSPHLVDFRERFQINGENISREDVLRIVDRVRKTGVHLTFFELTTAIAFVYFYEKKADYAVIEVGMGGRFDATNVIKKPAATAITSISFDHTDWLGDTLEKISLEKAGIAKEGVPMFTSVDNAVIRNECRKKSARVLLVDGEKRTNMSGSFQKKNAGMAAAICNYIGIPEAIIKAGLLRTEWPARLEFIEKNVLLDCAHNPDGVEKMAQFVNSLNRNVTIVFGVMKNKNYEEMIRLLPSHKTIILTKPKIDRSADPNELKKFCSNSIVVEDVAEAYERAKKMAGKDGLVLVCGSCYLAGELLARINKIEMHPIMFVQ